MRRGLEWVGRALITTGALLVLFVVYQLWGTGLLQAADQRELKDDFRDTVATATPTTDPEPDEEAEPAPEPEPPPPIEAVPGEAMGIVSVPAIGLEQALVEGVGREELKKGPGHYPHSPLPGHIGNVSVAGHRTTYGAPFNRLDELKAGDEIVVQTAQGTFTYEVTEQRIVPPGDTSVIDYTDDTRITLTTCNPKYSAKERLIVIGQLDGDPVDAAPPPDEPVPDELVSEDVPDTLSGIDDLDAGTRSGLEAIRQDTYIWTGLLLMVGGLWWMAAQQWRKWAIRIAGALPFLFVLFFFFGEVERLLPANY